MKKLILLLALVAFSYSIVFSQGCLPEGITFATQEEIDNFQTNYPGCTEIEGDVQIGSSEGNFNIMNLEGLNSLVKIDGDLDIIGCYCLGDLSGLNSITQVGGYLHISYCTELDNLSGLNSLTYVGGEFVVEWNYMLSDIQAFDSLTAIDGDFLIGHNNSLTNLAGLDNLNYIAGSVKIISNFALSNIDALKNINPDSIQVYLVIIGNFDLSDCAIQSICDYLEDPDNTAIISNNADGCKNKTEVEDACFTSTQELIENITMKVFPNPATDFIAINTKEQQPVEEIIIYNHLGQKVLKAKPVNNTMDVSELKPGIYFIELASQEWKGRNKFIKQ